MDAGGNSLKCSGLLDTSSSGTGVTETFENKMEPDVMGRDDGPAESSPPSRPLGSDPSYPE